jgi:hypothetical protein
LGEVFDVGRPGVLVLIILLLGLQDARGGSPDIVALPASLAGDTLKIQFSVRGFVTDEDSIALTEGEDISLICRLELWQKRKFWFDRLRSAITRYAGISYDRWQQKFILTTYNAQGRETSESYLQLDSLLDDFAKTADFGFVLESSDYEREGYVAYSFDLQYLTPDKLGELKDWLLKGEQRKPASKEAPKSSVPNRLLDLALSSTGFKNRSFLKSSDAFIPADLAGEIRFTKSVK